MTKQVQRRRGTATQHTSFTGAEGELSVNTTNKSVHVHDNVTAGGFEAARADMDNVTSSSILTAAGITATTAELNYVDGVTSNIQTQLDGKAGTASPTFTGTLTTANLTATGTTTLAGASTSADITFGDNDKAIFGAGSDLQIYHSGSNSHITEGGTGNLIIRADDFRVQSNAGEEYIAADANGAVSLRYDNASKLATTSTGIDVTGTVTADDVSIADTSPTLLFNRTDRATDNKIIRFAHDGEDFQLQLANDAVSSVTPAIAINRTGMTLDSIAFYEDTGTTAKFFWDASEESLGIGTSSPDTDLHVEADTPVFRLTNPQTTSSLGLSMGKIEWETRDSSAPGVIGYIDVVDSNNFGTTFDMAFATGQSGSATERMRIDSSGNVGIGTSSPQLGSAWNKVLHIHSSGGLGSHIRFTDTTSGETGESGLFIGQYGNDAYLINRESGSMLFSNNGTERMRISSDGSCRWTPDGTNPDMTLDASGNLLVGQTSANSNATGIGALPYGSLFSCRDGGAPFLVNRKTSDGDIALFQKDGAPVGSIGSYGGGANLFINSSTNALSLRVAGGDQLTLNNGNLYPTSDSGVNLGLSNRHFGDLHLSGGIIFGDAGSSGTSSSNELDSYEEGTWTPALGFNSNQGGITYATQDGQYTKIGNMVYVSGIIVLSSKGSNTGSASIAGLPFSTGDYLTATSHENAITWNYWSNYGDTADPQPKAYASGTGIILWKHVGGTAATNADFTNSTSMRFSGWYMAS